MLMVLATSALKRREVISINYRKQIAVLPILTMGLGPAASLLTPLKSLAQSAVDAGTLRQQIEREQTKTLPKQQKPLEKPVTKNNAPNNIIFEVKSFEFSGNKLLTSETLAAAVAPYLNRRLDMAGLEAAAAAAGEAYQRAGWLARVYLPEQTIDNGVVKLRVIESVFGKLLIEKNSYAGVSPERLQATLAAQQPAGTPLNLEAVERAKLLIEDVSGTSSSTNLTTGSNEGETDLILGLQDRRMASGNVTLDNSGARSTGRERLSAGLVLNSPLGAGDQLGTSLMHSNGSDYGRLSYTVPVGFDGFRFGFNASRLDYRVITPELASSKILGSSKSWGLEGSYPIVRQVTRNLVANFGYDDKSFVNEGNGTITSAYGTRNFTFSLSGNNFETTKEGSSSTVAGLEFTAGKVDLDGSPNQSDIAATTGVGGRFSKLRYNLSRRQTLSELTSINAALSGQLASKNLDSSEKFYLGGVSGVRAYPSNEGGGSEGVMLNLELRWQVHERWALTSFYDWGSVTVNKSNHYPGAPVVNRIDLQGAGISAAWSSPDGVTLQAIYARRLGSNPNRDLTTGKDQDGSLVRNRLWITASMRF